MKVENLKIGSLYKSSNTQRVYVYLGPKRFLILDLLIVVGFTYIISPLEPFED